VKVIVQREQRIRLQFPEYTAKLLFNPIDSVKKRSTVDAQPPAAQPPVRAQNEVIAEQAVFEIVQTPPGNQAKIGQILLVFPAPRGGPLLAHVRFNRDPAQVRLLCGAANKAIVADAKNGPQNAIAGR
jgi:hypothetical protein